MLFQHHVAACRDDLPLPCFMAFHFIWMTRSIFRQSEKQLMDMWFWGKCMRKFPRKFCSTHVCISWLGQPKSPSQWRKKYKACIDVIWRHDHRAGKCASHGYCNSQDKYYKTKYPHGTLPYQRHLEQYHIITWYIILKIWVEWKKVSCISPLAHSN